MLYLIKYKHNRMPEDYIGNAYKYAHNEAAAIKHFAPGKPSIDGWINKKNSVRVKILSTTNITNK